MSIVSMQKVFLCARKENRKDILETIQRLGVVEVSDMPCDEASFEKIDTNNNRLIFEKHSKMTATAAEIIEKFVESKAGLLESLNGRKQISKENYYDFVSNKEEIMRIAHDVVNLQEEIIQARADVKRCEVKREKMAPWCAFDHSLRFKGTKKTSAFIGTLPTEYTLDTLFSVLAENLPDVENISAEVVSAGLGQTCVFILCRPSDAPRLEEALKNLGFAYPAVNSKKAPLEKCSELEAKIKALEEAISQKEAAIKSYAGALNALKFICDYFAMRSQKYEVISRLAYSKNLFVLEGFVPKALASKLDDILSSNFDLALDFQDVAPGEAPVLLKNSKFSEPVESVVESYSLPGTNEVDPTSVMSIFYYILFGLMLSDAAYGAIMAIGCFIALKKFKNMELGLKKTLKMFLYCGISTTFWGAMFGSYFGNAVEVISETFFGTKIVIPPLWFTPLDQPMLMLSFSFGLGVLHIFAGLFLLMRQLIRVKKYKDVFFDVISWYLLIGGGVLYVLSAPAMTSLLGLGFTLPAVVGQISVVGVALGALCILFTAGRTSKSPLKRLLKGIYGLYGATSYLSDIFSYSRLFALGLATGVIAQVFNQMGAMAGGGIVGAILFTAVFLVGHTMNIAINLLGAYVHTNRLQFVEFFSKFYEGGGKKFAPFSAKTKFYKIKEEF